MTGLTYWFSGLPDPQKSKQYQLQIFGYDPDVIARILNARFREELITQRLLRRLSAEAIIHVIIRS